MDAWRIATPTVRTRLAYVTPDGPSSAGLRDDGTYRCCSRPLADGACSVVEAMRATDVPLPFEGINVVSLVFVHPAPFPLKLKQPGLYQLRTP